MAVQTLSRILHPASVAVIGASASPHSIAGAITENVARHFSGEVYLVNPKAQRMHGHKVHASIADLPQAPDLAIITSPADTVPGIVRDLAAMNTGGAVIISDPKRGSRPAAQLRRELIAIVRDSQMRIIGPYCLGLSVPGLSLYASMSRLKPRADTIAFVGQSATAAGPVIEWANSRGLGFSKVISLGDMIDVDYADILFYLAEDRETRVIVVYAERLPAARRFMSAARHAARIKPVIIIRPGAFTSHYLAGSITPDPLLPSRDAVYEGVFRRSGMLRVRTLEQLYDTVQALSARMPADVRPGRAARLAILSNGESLGAMAMDTLLELNGTLAELAPETVARLGAALPPGRARANPVDILADANGERYGAALDIMMDDPGTDAILVLAGPTGIAPAQETARAVVDVVNAKRAAPGRHRKWIMTSWPGGEDAQAARRIFADAQIPSFDTPSTAVTAFRVLQNHHIVSRALRETPVSVPEAFSSDPLSARTLIAEALARGHSALDAGEGKALLSAYALPPHAGEAHLSRLPVSWRIRAAVDPEFGPVIVLGLGGADGVLTDRPAVGLPPLNQTLAHDMILSHAPSERIFGRHGLPTEYREEFEALTLALMQVSQILVDQPGVAAIDIDPVRLTGGHVCWDTAEIRIALPDADPQGGASRLAIRPYPQELEERVTTRNGTALLLRPIRPEDEPAIHDFYNQLTDEDIRFRFFRPLKSVDHDFLAGLTQIDYDWHMAFVLTAPGLPGTTEVYGVVRLVRDNQDTGGEFAVIIRSDQKGQGLGRLLMNHIIDYGRRSGLERIYGLVLRQNRAMLHLCAALGFTISRQPNDPGVMIAQIRYGDDPAR